MKRIAVLLADGLEEIEGLTAVDLLRRAGIEVTMVSISEEEKVTGSHQITVIADEIFSKADFSKMDGVVLPGGMPGTTHLMEHEGVNRVIREFAGQKKLVAAICAAPSVLGQAGLLQGKKATCYPGFEGQLKGAICSDEQVVQDGDIITSRGMGTAVPFGLAITAYFLGQEKAKELKDSILYTGAGA